MNLNILVYLENFQMAKAYLMMKKKFLKILKSNNSLR